jgi:Tfp pilus assembly protein PilF
VIALEALRRDLSAGMLLLLAALTAAGCAPKNKKATSAEVLLNERMAAVLLRDGQCSEAEKAFQDVIKSDSKNAELYDGLGVAQLCQGKVKESLDSLDKAIKISPNRASFRIHRACAHTEVGHYALADEDFKWAEASTIPEDRLEIAINRGRLRQREGDFVRAEAEFGLALSMEPQSFPALVGRGVAREAKGDMSRAAEDYLEAVRLQPKNPEVNLRLGLALLSLKKYALGRRYLERTVELDPVGEIGAKARALLDKAPSS